MDGRYEPFARFAEHLLELACVANTEGRFLWLSKGWSKPLGWTNEKLLATPFIELVHPDDREATLQEVSKLDEGVPTIRFTNRYRTAGGEWCWLEWTAQPRDGLLFCFVRDVSFEREQALRDQHRMRLLQLSLALAKAGYWRVDLVRNKVEWSPEVYEIHGRDPASYTPTLEEGVEAYHPDDQHVVVTAIDRAIEDHAPFNFELRLVRPDGAIRNVVSSGHPEVDPSGRVAALFGVFRDATEDPAMLRQEELKQFAYVASHDLREPVRTIGTFVDLIRSGCELDSEHEQYFRYVSEASHRLTAMIRGLLEFARAGQEMRDESVPLDVVVHEVVADLDAAIKEKGVKLEVDALPVVMGARVGLRQVFQNLIANAIRFGPDQGGRVVVRSKSFGTTRVISVEDDGEGVDELQATRIFAPFHRLDTSKPGTGIGLSIVKRVVQQCGGRVWVERSALGGAEFNVALRAHVEVLSDGQA